MQRENRRLVIDILVVDHGGRIANTACDGLLLEFRSTVDAVRCAIALQDGMAQRDRGLAENNQINFCIGINVGDFVAEGDDLLA